MKKKIICIALAAAMIAASVLTSFAAVSIQSVTKTLKALDIMTGDEKGALNLDKPFTRAQLAKMLCASSVYKDTVGEDGLGYSLYSDVKSGFWASEYIKLCVEKGWMTGYTDGSFRPSAPVTLEEACAACLKVLGYKNSDLAGAFPYAQLSKAASIGLTDNIRGSKGSLMTRSDAGFMFYQLLTCENSMGQVYGQTLGYSVKDGNVDLTSVISGNMEGPFVAEQNQSFPFEPESFYLNDRQADSRVLEKNDVYYYNTGLKTVWIYNQKVVGKLGAVNPSSNPSSVTVSGKTYQIGSSDVSYDLSSFGSVKEDDMVTLLLGMDDKVVAMMTGDEVSGVYYGIVQSNNASFDNDSLDVMNTLTVFCTDGEIRVFSTEKNSIAEGRAVSVVLGNGKVSVKTIARSSVEGKFSNSGTSFAGYRLSENVNIIDTDGTSCAVIDAARLAGADLSKEKILLCVTEYDEITDMILNCATGENYSFGYMISAVNSSTAAGVFGSYTYMMDGALKTSMTQGISYSAKEGGCAIKFDRMGQISGIKNLTPVKLADVNNRTALAENARYEVADDVQVYVYEEDMYYPAELKNIDTDQYNMTGWYDDLGWAEKSMIRVIICSRKR